MRYKRNVFNTSIKTFLNPSTKFKVRHRRHKLAEYFLLFSDQLKSDLKQKEKSSKKLSAIELRPSPKNFNSASELLLNELSVKSVQAKGNVNTNEIIKIDKDNHNFKKKNEALKAGYVPDLSKNAYGRLGKITGISLHHALEEKESKAKLKKVIQTTFLHNVEDNNSRKKGTPRSINIPIRQIESSKIFLEIENERSYNEELFNQIGTYDDNWISFRERKNPVHFSLPLPNIRTGMFRDKITTTAKKNTCPSN